MRKVRTALDTSIRTKDVRSFSGRSGWSGRSTRGHPGGSASGFSENGTGWRRNISANAYRKEAVAGLSPSQRRAFEKLPVREQEELLIKTENKIDRRIRAGRYRNHGTTAAVAEGSAIRIKGRIRSGDPPVPSFAGRMDGPGSGSRISYSRRNDQFETRRFQNDLAVFEALKLQAVLHTGVDEQPGQKDGYHDHAEDEPSLPRFSQGADFDYGASHREADLFYHSIRRKKRVRQASRNAAENRLHAKQEAAGRTGMAGRLAGRQGQSGIFADRGKETGPGILSGRAAGEKAGRKISRDYAKMLGRLVESQVRFTKQLENSRSFYQRQRTIQEMEEKETKRVFRIVSFSLSKLKSAAGDLVKAAKFLASKGKGYLVLFLVPVMLLVMMVPLLLSSISITDEEATANTTAAQLVEYALSWVGVTQYIWGEGRAYETDWQDYTDCSGFVHGVFSHFGYEIGGDTVSMEGSGTLVDTNSTDQALPGDIILFFTGAIAPGNSTHVGIYIGNGQMVHCSGGRANVSPETAGPGVMVTMVAYDSRSYQVRRIIPESAAGGIGTGGHRVDPTNYSLSDLELIWAIVAQEDNGSYEGALAVISSAMNRTDSPVWGYLGSTAMQQLCAPGQYCYSNDHYWEARLGGNVPEYVKQAVNDCLKKGIRNHSFTCFRSTKGSETGPNAVQVGGNWFFGN